MSLTLETVSYQVYQYQTSASDEEKSRHTLLSTFEFVTFLIFWEMKINMVLDNTEIVNRHMYDGIIA